MSERSWSEFQFLLVPGLYDSGPAHWQSRWQRLYPGFARVLQRAWDRPELAVWSAQVDRARRRDKRPVLLVAHSFGCLASVHSIAADPDRVAGALLVAPADPDKFGIAAALPAGPLPCPSVMIASRDDPWMSSPRAAQWARRWGSALVDAGALGHINADSDLGFWPFGLSQLQALVDLAHNERQAIMA